MIEQTNTLQTAYAYCTDFIINLANSSGLSYYEINVFLFCLLYPLLLIGLSLVFFIQKRRLRKRLMSEYE
jgi:hypothetical protein